MSKARSRSKKRPVLFATLGFPGSGKTHFSRRFARDLDLVHVNSDKARSALFRRPTFSKAENAAVFRAMDERAAAALGRGKSVIYDANSTKRSYRREIMRLARKRGARYLLLWFQVPVATALGRIKTRRMPRVDRFVLLRIRKAIEEPRREPHVVLDGRDPYEKQRKTVLSYLKKSPL